MPTGAKHVDERAHHSLVGYLAQRFGRGLVGVVVLGVAVAGVTVALTGRDAGAPTARTPCPEHTLALAADPAVADVLTEATADLSRWVADDQCLRVDVTAVPSAQVAADVARPPGRGLGSALPDAWVPESSHWLAVAQGTTAGRKRLDAEAATSLASSPIVIAVAADRAGELGWPDTQPTWDELVATDAGEWRLGTPDPARAAAGLAGLLAAGTDADTLTTLGRRLELPSLQEQTAADLVAAGDLDAAPDSELDVLAANRSGDGVVAAYDPALKASLDFPLVALADDRNATDRARERDLATLREALEAPETRQLLEDAGLRGPDGALPAAYDAEDGVLDQPAPPPLEPAAREATQALDAWTRVGRRSRLLVLVDRSGSMAETLPGGTEAKSDLARASVAELIDSSAPDSDIGLWTFTTGEGQQGIDTLVEVGSLGDPAGAGTRRDQLLAALPELAPDPIGGTPLYRAVLAAYSWSLDHYAFGRLNAVVVVTDGRDEDTTQTPIPRTEMLDTLRQQYDGMRPVPIITLAYGEDVDAAVLREISDVTGGQAYQGLTQQQVTGLLTEALARS